MDFIFSLTEIKEVAAKVYEAAKDKKVWAMHGEMGAGKTTFIHALCDVLNVTSAVGSPTYAIINEYKSAKAGIIYHMDWYRLKDEDEALQAGVEDTMHSGNLCLIEWADKFPDLLPDDCLRLELSVIDAERRRLIIQ